MQKSIGLLISVFALVLLIGSTGAVVTAASAESSSSAASELSVADLSGATSSAIDAQKQVKGEKKHAGGKSGVRVDVISVAASVLGETGEEVKESVKAGKVGDLLVEAGKVDEFKAAYLAEAKSKLDAAVTAGSLTQAQADEKYAEAKDKMDAYDGTTHLCGGTDHSKFGEKLKTTDSTADA
jgi:hypothetical protein